jgi:hypothetical protein
MTAVLEVGNGSDTGHVNIRVYGRFLVHVVFKQLLLLLLDTVVVNAFRDVTSAPREAVRLGALHS